MSWNFRVVKEHILLETLPQVFAKFYPDGYDRFKMYEIYYHDKNDGDDYDNIEGYCEHRELFSEEVEDLKGTLELMLKAFDKPILELIELEKLFEKQQPKKESDHE